MSDSKVPYVKRRTVLVSLLVGLTGCAWDRTNDGRITIVASEIPCSETTIDVNFDTRDSSQAVKQTVDEIVSVDEYTATPPYDSGTMEIYDILHGSSDRNDGTMKHDGRCYEFTVQRIFDD